MKNKLLLVFSLAFLLSPGVAFMAPATEFSLSPDWRSYNVLLDGAVKASFSAPQTYGAAPTLPSVFRESDQYAYFRSSEDYVYRFDKISFQLQNLSANCSGNLDDISENDLLGVCTGYQEETGLPFAEILNFEDGSKRTIEFPSHFSQIGAASFSPSGQQLVIPLAKIEYGQISSSLFLFDSFSNIARQVYDTKFANNYILVEGWRDQTPVYQEKQLDADYYYGDGVVDPELNEG